MDLAEFRRKLLDARELELTFLRAEVLRLRLLLTVEKARAHDDEIEVLLASVSTGMRRN